MSLISLAPEQLTQAINPWSLAIKSAGQQFGFINVYNQRTAEPNMEAQIVQGVASYGRQLGRIIGAIQVLLKHEHLDPRHLPKQMSDEDWRAIQDFDSMARQIDDLKSKSKADREHIAELEQANAQLQRKLRASIEREKVAK